MGEAILITCSVFAFLAVLGRWTRRRNDTETGFLLAFSGFWVLVVIAWNTL